MEHPKIQQYRFVVLYFGLTPSLAILNGVIQYHLGIIRNKNTITAKLISDSLYVDDFLGGCQPKEDGFDIYQLAMTIMKHKDLLLENGQPIVRIYKIK